jgi:hypothetical protein
MQNGRGLSLNDLDTFDDLRWEREMTEQASGFHNRHEESVNLTSKIEDYLRTHF